jgi:hypothetical protein
MIALFSRGTGGEDSFFLQPAAKSRATAVEITVVREKAGSSLKLLRMTKLKGDRMSSVLMGVSVLDGHNAAVSHIAHHVFKLNRGVCDFKVLAKAVLYLAQDVFAF